SRFLWAHNQTHRRTPYLIVRVPLSNGASIDKDLLRHGPVQSPFKLNGLFASVGHIVNLAQESIGSSGSHFIVAVKPRRHDNIISAFFVVDVALTRWASQGGALPFDGANTLARQRNHVLQRLIF